MSRWIRSFYTDIVQYSEVALMHTGVPALEMAILQYLKKTTYEDPKEEI